MTRVLKLLLVSCLLPALASADPMLNCAAKFSSGDCVGIEWEHDPAEGEYGILRFTTFSQTESGSKNLDLGEKVEMVLWMPSMGHGSSPVSVEKLAVGSFRATRIFFSMPGEWELRFIVKSAGEIRDRATILINR